MLSPKKTKYRKQFKGKIHGVAKGGFSLNFGSYGLKSVEPERITARQIEAARRAITRQMKRQGRVWIRIFPDVPVTVNVYVPPATAAVGVTVNRLEPEPGKDDGVKLAVAPEGTPVTLKLTTPVKPLIGVTLTVNGNVAVGSVVIAAGLALNEKSPLLVTVSEIWADWSQKVASPIAEATTRSV